MAMRENSGLLSRSCGGGHYEEIKGERQKSKPAIPKRPEEKRSTNVSPENYPSLLLQTPVDLGDSFHYHTETPTPFLRA
ncbi:hypothetical protein ACN42_g5026 [Penicillium freii]|uniref:Uncharacterized protein n=1 Tax=Penicillium freii TaxID=48697 RepID=A0A117NPC4_PENFR|nr:hypothetical protein ACN42_g5026 [Penicillium freii]